MANENSEAVLTAPEVTSPDGEKLLKQSEVNSLIGRAKADAHDKATRQAQAEHKAQLAQLEAEKHAAEKRGDDPTEINVEKVYDTVHERLQNEMQQRQFEEQMRQVADTYQDKISKGSKNYEDYETVVKDFNPGHFPQVVLLLHQMDNAADVVYELSKNPQKLANIDLLAQRSPVLAQNELKKLGKSIQANQAAATQEADASAPAPLDRPTPSNKTGSNGQMSVTDLRNQPWLRG